MNKQKTLGQVFTPDFLVKNILDYSKYISNGRILKKHIIDNSCGQGAFLVEIVKRYCEDFLSHNTKKRWLIKEQLEKYIHGIELDKEAYNQCIKNLNDVALEYKLCVPSDLLHWDIHNEDALTYYSKYKNRMDFVIGNPPYSITKNISKEQDENMKKFHFANDGVTNLYLAFFEIGLKMLKPRGVLTYITPSSWISGGKIGQSFIKYITNNNLLEEIVDLEHYQPFEGALTYTAITKLHYHQDKCFKYYTYDEQKHDRIFIKEIHYNEDSIHQNTIHNYVGKQYVQVKEGFQTNSNSIYIKDEFPKSFNDCVIDIIKANTGKISKCLYPYDENGELIEWEELPDEIQEYFNDNVEELYNAKKQSKWYAFGRSQGIKDTYKDKIAICNIIKNLDDLKINLCPAGMGIYGGSYIIGENLDYQKIYDILHTEDFMNYVKSLRKYKSGGYYFFSAHDLGNFLNYKLSLMDENRISPIIETRLW